MAIVVPFDAAEIGNQILEAMSVAREEYAGEKLVIHVKTQAQIDFAATMLRMLDGTRVLFELEVTAQDRVYHNGQKVFEIYFEDYANCHGWRRDYVPVGTWKAAEIDRLVANAS